MTAAPVTVDTPLCSFCLKESNEVEKLIAGPGVYICDGCVGRCTEIIGSGAAQRPWRESVDDAELLHHLKRVATAGAQVDRSLHVWVGTLRERGVTWSRIGEALDMTRQSAWERFSGED